MAGEQPRLTHSDPNDVIPIPQTSARATNR